MLNYALAFILIAILAAVVGLSGLAVASLATVKLLFFAFVAMFVSTIALGVTRERSR